MQTNNILTADLLDILFDNRNKDYGAYQLRKTYPKQITKALLVTGTITLLIFGSLLARSPKPEDKNKVAITTVDLSSVKEEKQPELPRPEKKPELVQVRKEIFTPPVIVENVEKPIPTIDDLKKAQIDLVKQEGIDPDGFSHPNIDSGKGVIEIKPEKEPEIFIVVEIGAKFIGNWKTFLERNLNPEIPINNGAPAGNYTVEVQFVVDIEGNVSDIKPLSNVGYGMEQEAVRVLKKATKWEPAIQNGRKVKAYHKQRIIFQVLGDQ